MDVNKLRSFLKTR